MTTTAKQPTKIHLIFEDLVKVHRSTAITDTEVIEVAGHLAWAVILEDGIMHKIAPDQPDIFMDGILFYLPEHDELRHGWVASDGFHIYLSDSFTYVD